MSPVYLKVSISGHRHTQLRKQIDCHLQTARGFYKMRLGRKLVNHFHRAHGMPPQECANVIAALYAIDSAFGPDAYIKELHMSCFPSLHISFKA